MLTVVLMVNMDEGWWVGSGATCQMTLRMSVFKTDETLDNKKIVFMGNSSSSVIGKRIVQFSLTSRKALTL